MSIAPQITGRFLLKLYECPKLLTRLCAFFYTENNFWGNAYGFVFEGIFFKKNAGQQT